MKTHKIIVIILSIILLLILYNLYKNDNKNIDENINYLEHFGVLDKIKKKNKNNNKYKKENYEDTNSSNISKYHKSIRSLKTDKGMSFEDVLKAGEAIDPEKLTIESMKKELSIYNKSFSKEKFKNNSKNTTEAFEKFGLYKEKFFELFK